MNKWMIGIAVWAMALPVWAQDAWDLRRCIEYAVAHNLTVKQQEEACRQSETELSTARWSRLPNLNGKCVALVQLWTEFAGGQYVPECEYAEHGV